VQLVVLEAEVMSGLVNSLTDDGDQTLRDFVLAWINGE
jgi:hypothetical protein